MSSLILTLHIGDKYIEEKDLTLDIDATGIEANKYPEFDTSGC